MFHIVSALIILVVYGIPAALVGVSLTQFRSPLAMVLALTVAPLVYSVLFVAVAGSLSLPFQKAIIAGKFPRALSHPIYRARRIYGLCWTCVYYCKPVYFICLSIPILKRMTFRLFGYRGSMDFTIYPDTWIRDLPLLDFGEGAYISNRATLGTNMALRNGTILVDGIKIGRKALVGHLTMLAPGVVMDEGAEVSVGCSIGIRATLGRNSVVNAASIVNHHANIGVGASVGYHACVGMRVRVGADLDLPSGIVVPSRITLRTKEDVARYVLTPASGGPGSSLQPGDQERSYGEKLANS